MSVPWFARVSVAAAILLAGCAGEPAVPQTTASPEPAAPEPAAPRSWYAAPVSNIDYDGPPVAVEISGEPAVLRLRASVPTGGYVIDHDGTEKTDGETTVSLTLWSPGADESASQAETTVEAEVDLPEVGNTVQVRVRAMQRGAHYFREPPYQLASVMGR